MKISFWCDLHLPFDKNAPQYDVLDWAVSNVKEEKPDCIVFAGDVTCDGNISVYEEFLRKMQELGVPFLYIPGNSDLRCAESRDRIKNLASPCENIVNGVKIFALNDCDGTISREQFAAVENADSESVVFMHHPEDVLSPATREKLANWRQSHKETMLFYGHLHETRVEGTSISLQAMDPDKAIGECPCVTYYHTDSKTLQKAYFPAPMPKDLSQYFGISCYRAVEQTDFAAEKGLKYLELRPNCIKEETEALKAAVARWREAGGKNLCIHLPDVAYGDGDIQAEELDRYMELAEILGADRLTQHVPMVSVEKVKSDPAVLENICKYLADKFNTIGYSVVVGVENMHMTAADAPDDTRRFGYVPEECIAFMEGLRKVCKHPVGINFDIGHARNNAPYSQKYQIGTWLSMVGKYIIGYHIHQVTLTDGKFGNHMPITDVYGKLISYASFFRCWSDGKINKAPMIFEMRPDGAYEITLETFKKAEC